MRSIIREILQLIRTITELVHWLWEVLRQFVVWLIELWDIITTVVFWTKWTIAAVFCLTIIWVGKGLFIKARSAYRRWREEKSDPVD